MNAEVFLRFSKNEKLPCPQLLLAYQPFAQATKCYVCELPCAIMPTRCLVCCDGTPEVRLACGHLVCCWSCFEHLSCCPLCRQVGRDFAFSSSGTNTFSNPLSRSESYEWERPKCIICDRSAAWTLECIPCLVQDPDAVSRTTLMVCDTCLANGCPCPVPGCGNLLSQRNIHSKVLHDSNSILEQTSSGSSVGTSPGAADVAATSVHPSPRAVITRTNAEVSAALLAIRLSDGNHEVVSLESSGSSAPPGVSSC